MNYVGGIILKRTSGATRGDMTGSFSAFPPLRVVHAVTTVMAAALRISSSANMRLDGKKD